MKHKLGTLVKVKDERGISPAVFRIVGFEKENYFLESDNSDTRVGIKISPSFWVRFSEKHLLPLAVCCVVRNKENPELILLVSRKDDLSAFGLPGGKVDLGEGIQTAIVREVYEETGLTIIPGPVIYETLCPKHAPDGQDYYAYALLAMGYTGEISTQETGIVKWGTWEDQATGNFSNYNLGVKQALTSYLESND